MAAYERLPTAENDSLSIFDYSSPFTYNNSNSNYRSIFTFGPTSNVNQAETSGEKATFIEKFFTQLLIFFCYGCVFLTAPISFFFVIKKIPQHERIVVFRLGRMQAVKGPGTVLILPMADRYHSVDLRMRAFIIPPQLSILTDDAIVEVGAEIRFRIKNIPFSTLNVKDLDGCLRALGRNLLITSLSKSCVHDLQTKKENFNQQLLSNFNFHVDKWGLEVVYIELSAINVRKNAEHHPALNRLLGALSNSFNNPTNEQSSKLQTLLSSPSLNNDPIENYLQKLKQTSDQSSCLKDVDGCFCLKVNQNDKIKIYNFTIKDGRVELYQEPIEQPDVMLTVDENDLLDIFNAELSPLEAYISNKIKINGDIQLVTNLASVLKSIKIS